MVHAASLLLFALVACGSAPAPQERFWEERPPSQFTTRFPGQVDESLPPQDAFAARAACARLTQARFETLPRREGTRFGGRLTLRGEGLERVQRVVAALPDGKLAEIQPQPAAEGALELPVLQADCEIWLGVRLGGRVVSCTGPGWSLRVQGGRLAD
jgi:hypothetical protein